jgi:hypothetical protein
MRSNSGKVTSGLVMEKQQKRLLWLWSFFAEGTVLQAIPPQRISRDAVLEMAMR